MNKPTLTFLLLVLSTHIFANPQDCLIKLENKISETLNDRIGKSPEGYSVSRINLDIKSLWQDEPNWLTGTLSLSLKDNNGAVHGVSSLENNEITSKIDVQLDYLQNDNVCAFNTSNKLKINSGRPAIKMRAYPSFNTHKY